MRFTTILLCVGFAVGGSSSALLASGNKTVMDSLTCQLALTDNISGKTSRSTSYFGLVREKVKDTPSDQLVTVARNTFNKSVVTNDHQLHVIVNFRFGHASLLNDANQVTDSRQMVWIESGSSFCLADETSCEISLPLVHDATPPFDPASGWHRVGIMTDSIFPAFDIKDANPRDFVIKDKNGTEQGKFSIQCTLRNSEIIDQ